MAISCTQYLLLRELQSEGVLPQGCRILEIGKANYYGDMEPKSMLPGASLIKDKDASARAERFIASLQGEPTPEQLFELATIVYRIIFNTATIVSIDLDPCASDCIRHDLNEPYDDGVKYDVTFNHGTAEHVFNIAQVFRTMHDSTKVGGLMIHESPFTGWIDHGFYNLQPTLFWDVAKANNYDVVLFAGEHLPSKTAFKFPSREAVLELRHRDQLPDNLMLFVVLRKTTEAAFAMPMQGVYAGTAGDAARHAWKGLR